MRGSIEPQRGVQAWQSAQHLWTSSSTFKAAAIISIQLAHSCSCILFSSQCD